MHFAFNLTTKKDKAKCFAKAKENGKSDCIALGYVKQ